MGENRLTWRLFLNIEKGRAMLRRFIAGLLVYGFTVGTAYAAPTVTFAVDPTNTIPGVTARKLVVDGGGVDAWLASVLVIELTSGSIHNAAVADSDRPQPGLWVIPGFEEHRWDTWVGIPGGVNDVGPLGAGDLSSPSLSMSGQLVSVSWGSSDTTNTGPTLIANISLTNDAQGTWRMLTGFGTAQVNVLIQTEGFIIPEPGTLALLGLCGPGLLSRARRRL